MGYLFLAAGVILIVLGSTKIETRRKDEPENEVAKQEPFNNTLSDELILQKLDKIELRLDIIEGKITTPDKSSEGDGNITPQSPKINHDEDINSSIAEMLKNGFTVDEVSEKYGITKGEVLLRAHLKE